MAEIAWTIEAERWLREIHDYIAQDNPEAAWRTIEGIRQKVLLLRQFPELGYRHWPSPMANVRILLYGHYRIAYLIKSDESIEILGIFHAAFDDINRFL